MTLCKICPRECRVDREKDERGFCGVGRDAVVSHVCKHFFEEPVISGRNGSGAVFFGGCNLRCVFCQNKDISRGVHGKTLDAVALSELFLKTEESGVHNINLVTPTPHVMVIVKALERIKDRLRIPIVYNTSLYETKETVRMLDGLVDIYLPDLKYADNEIALRYSLAPKYVESAFSALEEMLRQQPACVVEDGIMKKGVIVRHLCLPSRSGDSLAVLERLSRYLDKYDLRLSLMSQYTPEFLDDPSAFKEINRRITSLEYGRVSKKAIELGFEGYFQERTSACKDFTPDFDAECFGESERIDINEF